jgi:hypothetical protein
LPVKLPRVEEAQADRQRCAKPTASQADNISASPVGFSPSWGFLGLLQAGN